MISMLMCVYCKLYKGYTPDKGELTCKAFPDKIPDVIVNGGAHWEPLNGEATFEPKSPDAKRSAERLWPRGG